MLNRNGRRVLDMALVLCAMGTINACAPASRTSPEDLRPAYPLLVNNQSDFEVVVYSMASATTRGVRLGTARPYATTRLRIPSYALMSQETFAVQLHAIGAARTTPNWVSAGTVLRENLVAHLNIIGDTKGNLKMSHLSARLGGGHR